jgi:polysaccharide pyruvyl transferase WcaK-like protein
VDRQTGKHVVLFGQFGIGNTGNDATAAVTLEFLQKRLPGSRFTLVSNFPETASRLFSQPIVDMRGQTKPRFPWRGPLREFGFELNRRREADKLLATADCLLVPGTGIFDDLWSRASHFAIPLWRWCRTAKRFGVPVRFVSVGAGPVEGSRSRRIFRSSAALASHRSYRDRISWEFVRDVFGLDVSKDAVTPDLVFGMELEPSPPAGSTGVIAIGTMDYHTWNGVRGGKDDVYEDYMSKLAAFCQDLLKQGRALRMIIGDPGDAPAVADLVGRLEKALPGHAGSVSVANIATLRDLVREIGRTDAVVATRYHTVLGGLICGRPTVSIEYAAKNTEMMKQFGLASYCQHITRLNLDLLRRQFAEVTADIPKMSGEICGVRDGMRDTVRSHLEKVAAEIAG